MSRYPIEWCITRFWARVQKSEECWEISGRADRDGYVRLRNKLALFLHESACHRVSWTLTFGRIEGGKLVLHHCDNKRCVRPSHLYLGTDWDNAQDREIRHRMTHVKLLRESNPAAKLTQSDANTIRDLYHQGIWTQMELAHLFGVGRTTIIEILRGKRWPSPPAEESVTVTPQL